MHFDKRFFFDIIVDAEYLVFIYIDIFMDISFFLEIMLNFFIATSEKGTFVLDFKKIAWNYIS